MHEKSVMAMDQNALICVIWLVCMTTTDLFPFCLSNSYIPQPHASSDWKQFWLFVVVTHILKHGAMKIALHVWKESDVYHTRGAQKVVQSHSLRPKLHSDFMLYVGLFPRPHLLVNGVGNCKPYQSWTVHRRTTFKEILQSGQWSL